MTNPNNRFQAIRVDGSSFQVIDTIHRVEICAVSDFEIDNDGNWTNDAQNRAMTIAACLNKAAWDYRPTLIR